MQIGLLHLHNALRWAVLLVLVAAVIKAIRGNSSKAAYTAGDKKLALFTLIFSHLQLVLGLILYFTSSLVSSAMSDMGVAMKNKVLRFYSIEHMLMMVIAIALITVGYSTAKRAADDATKHKKIAVFYTIALILILSAIPWPFRELIGRPWF